MASACPAGTEVHDISECEAAAAKLTNGITAVNPPLHRLSAPTYVSGGFSTGNAMGHGCITSSSAPAGALYGVMWWNTFSATQTDLGSDCLQVCHDYCPPSAPPVSPPPSPALPPPSPLPRAPRVAGGWCYGTVACHAELGSACPAGMEIRDIDECEMAAPYVTDGATAANPPVQNLTIQTYTLGGPWVSDEWGLGCITSTGMQASDGKFAAMWWNTHMPSQTNLSAACRQVCYEYCSPSAPTTPAAPPTASPPPPPPPSFVVENAGALLLIGTSALVLILWTGLVFYGICPFWIPVRPPPPPPPDAVIYGLREGFPFGHNLEPRVKYGVKKPRRNAKGKRSSSEQRLLLGPRGDRNPPAGV